MNYKIGIPLLLYCCILVWRFTNPVSTPPAEPHILGGVVPHHLYVADIIGGFFQNISTTPNVAHVTLLGPDHLGQGSSNITFHPSFPDQSVTALLPFIRSTFGSASITPILLKHDTTLEECQELAAQIHAIPGKNLLIASIDFSHYLTTFQAQQKDQEIMQMIESRDYDRILRLGDNHLDSPPSLVTALIYFDKYTDVEMEILGYSNSGLRGNPFAPTTSYYTFVFYGK